MSGLARNGSSTRLPCFTRRVSVVKRVGRLRGSAVRWKRPPPRAASGPNDPGSAGLAYTGLGVGNRNGVYAMLGACTLAVIGMMYAFYVKPVLKRRRVRRVHEQIARERNEADAARAMSAVSSEVVSV